LGALVLGERLKTDVCYLIPNEKLFVLPNSIPDIKTKYIKTYYDIQTNVEVLFLSHIMPSKGPIEFLIMAKNIVQKYEKVHFYLAGPKMDKYYFNEIIEFIEKEDLKNFVTVIGPVYGEKKLSLFKKIDIFVFPTQNEAFGLVNLEAMRAGIPIVSTDQGSIPEIVIDGVNGFIVHTKDIDMLTDRVFNLIINPEIRIEMGKASRSIYEKKYTIYQYKKRLKNALEFFIEQKKSA
jgi:glycosyltransferase involved in cell wall biosynthesis